MLKKRNSIDLNLENDYLIRIIESPKTRELLMAGYINSINCHKYSGSNYYYTKYRKSHLQIKERCS